MLTTSDGKTISTETAIFPLVTFFPDKKTFSCLGTGFFINSNGGFVTAKHVFFQNSGDHVPTLFGVQSTESGERIVRSISHFVVHNNADIAVGFLSDITVPATSKIPLAPAFSISTKPINVGDKIKTFAFPLTRSTFLDEERTQFTFKGKWSEGEVLDYHHEGISLLKNPCYQTTMKIEHGASGGPVLKGHYVIGINSTGMDVQEGDIPISFITPINLIEDLVVPSDIGETTMKFIIENGGIGSEK